MHSLIKTLLRPVVKPIKAALRPVLYSRRPPLCDNVVQRCLDSNYPVKRIHEPFLVEFPIPRGSETDPKAAPLFYAHSKIGLPALTGNISSWTARFIGPGCRSKSDIWKGIGIALSAILAKIMAIGFWKICPGFIMLSQTFLNLLVSWCPLSLGLSKRILYLPWESARIVW
jgi:hypothetical protein